MKGLKRDNYYAACQFLFFIFNLLNTKSCLLGALLVLLLPLTRSYKYLPDHYTLDVHNNKLKEKRNSSRAVIRANFLLRARLFLMRLFG